jgi:hypothetical protein
VTVTVASAILLAMAVVHIVATVAVLARYGDSATDGFAARYTWSIPALGYTLVLIYLAGVNFIVGADSAAVRNFIDGDQVRGVTWAGAGLFLLCCVGGGLLVSSTGEPAWLEAARTPVLVLDTLGWLTVLVLVSSSSARLYYRS